MPTLGARIKARRTEIDVSVKSIAAAVGVSPQAVYAWERGDIESMKDKHLVGVATILRVSEKWLLNGGRQKDVPSDNTAPGPDVKSSAPLISWVKAGKFSEAIDSYRVGDAEDWLPMPKRAGPHSYCLRVEGDSMTAPHGKSYPAGCLIFVDPDKRTPDNGQRVIAKLKGSEDVTFKVFVRDGSKVFLKPLNPQYPPMHEAFRVIGTVVGKWEDE
jgi:SOS-response transcriptional repressor LexA